MLRKIIASAALLFATYAFAAVDVNKATEAELDGVRGIGPTTTKEILVQRQKGQFKDWDDLIQRVKGIGSARATKLSAEGLTVGGSSYSGSGVKQAVASRNSTQQPKKEVSTGAAKEAKQ